MSSSSRNGGRQTANAGNVRSRDPLCRPREKKYAVLNLSNMIISRCYFAEEGKVFASRVHFELSTESRNKLSETYKRVAKGGIVIPFHAQILTKFTRHVLNQSLSEKPQGNEIFTTKHK